MSQAMRPGGLMYLHKRFKPMSASSVCKSLDVSNCLLLVNFSVSYRTSLHHYLTFCNQKHGFTCLQYKYEQFHLFPQCFLLVCIMIYPFPVRKLFYVSAVQFVLPNYTSKLTEFADNNFKFDENGGKFSKSVENTEGKGQIDCFPTLFSKDLYCRQVKARACLEKGKNTMGKGEIAHKEQFLLFTQCFLPFC